MSMRILVISYYYAPQNTIGAIRPTKLVKYLERMGHQVTVLCGGGLDAKVDPTLQRDLEQMKDVLPSLALAAVMFPVVNAMNALSWPAALLLAAEIAVGVTVYAGLALVLRLESAQFLLDMVKGMLRRRA